MEKVIRDGKVAVLSTSAHGAGWHTWGAPIEAVFDPEMVEAVLANNHKLAEEIAKRKWSDVYEGGVKNLEVEWIPQGMPFRIREYDGLESIECLGDIDFIVA
jgi:ferredoxin-fold anticodon binding domain-containing protein